MLVPPTQPDYQQLVYKCFVPGVAVNVMSPHPGNEFLRGILQCTLLAIDQTKKVIASFEALFGPSEHLLRVL